MKEKTLMEEKILEYKELIPGMRIIEDKNPQNRFIIIYAERFRDSKILCLDNNGHSVLIPAWNGDYSIITEKSGIPKVRIAYGKTPFDKINITEDFFYDEEDFKEKFPMYYFWYVEALRGTRKII